MNIIDKLINKVGFGNLMMLLLLINGIIGVINADSFLCFNFIAWGILLILIIIIFSLGLNKYL